MVVVVEAATKPSRFADLWQDAQFLARATHNDVRTSKSAPYPSFFCTFDLEMWFAPQRRALFRHLNFQKVVRTWCVFYILTSKCSSRHNGVHFFDITTSKGAPNVVLCTFWLRNVLLLSSDSFSSLIFCLLLFSSLILLISAFPSVHIVRSLTSKLPSVIIYNH